MAFIGSTKLGHLNSLNYTVDIVGIPAIGADPVGTWGSEKDNWLRALGAEISGARLLLYDHYRPEERSIEVKPRSHPDHSPSVEKYAAAQERLAELGIDGWAERFINALHRQRNSPALHRRPVIFICHSTGGIVLKQALSRKLADKEANVAAYTLLIAYFSTPHKGSTVLSDHAFTRAVQNALKLKWEMGEKLRRQLATSSPELDALNHSFCSGASMGIQIASYVETEETQLEVLTEAEGETLTTVSVMVVDPHSAEMTSSNSPMEEDLFYMRTNHIGIAALANDSTIRRGMIENIKDVVRSTNSDERAAHHELIKTIMNDVNIDVHQFYQVESRDDATGTRIWSESASFRTFLETGHAQILRRRLGFHEKPDSSVLARRTGSPSRQVLLPPVAGNNRKPSIMLDPAPCAPPSKPKRKATDNSNSANLMGRKFLAQPEANVGDDIPIQSAHAYPGPSTQRDRFKWIHIPFSVTGWVGPVMTTIAKDEGVPELGSKLLMDQMWMAHHNRSRHSSHHSHFVRSYCKVLTPRENHHDELLQPSSAISELQFALYMPYIHWDTFRSLKARNAVIKKRSEQGNVRPIANDILKGNSLEHKVIWQFLTSNMPLHCRRTLDQYGYPSLANTEARDMDQVMFKRTNQAAMGSPTTSKRSALHNFGSRLYTKRTGQSKPQPMKPPGKGTAYVLMVDELWLWILRDDCMLTFATPKEKEEDTPYDLHLQADIRTNVLKDVSGDFARQVDDCFDHAALMVFHATRALIENAEDPALNVFRTFEEHISEISELHTLAFKQFRDSHKIDDPKMLLASSKNLDYSSDLDNLLELRDVDDELNTIKKLFVEQRKLVSEMLRQYDEDVNPRGKGIHGTILLKEAENTLMSYEEQVENMIKSSKVAQDAFENLLDLKQKHGNIVEAHMTRYQTEMASEQSRSVMIFTVFTIIFLPLSFFASIFGMNVSDWSGTPTNPTLSYVLTIMGCISLAVILLAIIAAFHRATRKYCKMAIRYVWRRFLVPLRWMMARSPIAKLRRTASEMDLENGLLTTTKPTPSIKTMDELEKEKSWMTAPDSLDVEEVWVKSNVD